MINTPLSGSIPSNRPLTIERVGDSGDSGVLKLSWRSWFRSRTAELSFERDDGLVLFDLSPIGFAYRCTSSGVGLMRMSRIECQALRHAAKTGKAVLP